MIILVKSKLFSYGRVLVSLAILVVFGFLKIPFESQTEQKLKDKGFRDWVPNMSAREQLTQASFIGAIGGFRSLVASIYDLRAHEAFGFHQGTLKVPQGLQCLDYILQHCHLFHEPNIREDA